jgi:hypothetical protein
VNLKTRVIVACIVGLCTALAAFWGFASGDRGKVVDRFYAAAEAFRTRDMEALTGMIDERYAGSLGRSKDDLVALMRAFSTHTSRHWVRLRRIDVRFANGRARARCELELHGWARSRSDSYWTRSVQSLRGRGEDEPDLVDVELVRGEDGRWRATRLDVQEPGRSQWFTRTDVERRWY